MTSCCMCTPRFNDLFATSYAIPNETNTTIVDKSIVLLNFFIYKIKCSMLKHEIFKEKFLGYDMGDNTEIYDLINEIDALVTKVVNLIHDVVIEVDEILHGNKVVCATKF